MRFNFSAFNHCPQGKLAVTSIAEVMAAQIEAVGHAASIVQDAKFIGPEEGVNAVFESFADPAYPALPTIAAARAAGCRFVYVATEEPTPAGFNHGYDPAMVRRQEAFEGACAHAEAILHLVPGVTDWYARLAPAAHVELGHAPGLERMAEREPEYDYGFYGQVTSRRAEILGRLGAGKVLAVSGIVRSQREVDAEMARARVVVQIRANPDMGLVSSSRLNTALHVGRPVVAEPHQRPGPWASIVHFARSLDAFYADAAAAVRDWRRLHAAQFSAFRATLTPEASIGAPLRAVGLL